ncbi:uncharacterized protein LOC126816078 isoform X2 [Patella vulgata]|nr:uncharacterized protein LOC126816078 isoform X2 [Patella vulgata]
MYCRSTDMAKSTLVHKVTRVVNRCSSDSSSSKGSSCSSVQRTASPSLEKSKFNDLSCIRNQFGKRGFSEQATTVIMASWKSGTKKQYQVYHKRWFQYCRQEQINPLCPSIKIVINFLASLFSAGLGYSALNTARGALSSLGLVFEGFTVGCHPLVIRFLRGVFNLRPTQARYTCIWDVAPVLKYLQKLSPVAELSLKNLTLKLVMLIALICASRIQSLHCLKLCNMLKRKSSFVFVFTDVLKVSRPNFHVPEFVLNSYPPDRRLCVYTGMKQYLERTERLRENMNGRLFISYIKPHNCVSRDTIARWLKCVMYSAGVDTSVFTAHSVRSAVVSRAKLGNVPIKDIMSKAGWTNVGTFRKYYDKHVINNEEFSISVLKV